MTGGPNFRLGAPDGAVPGRLPGGKPARAGEKPSTPFDALLTRAAPKGDAGHAAGGEVGSGEKPSTRFDALLTGMASGDARAARGGEARPFGPTLDSRGMDLGRAAAMALEGSEAEPEVVTLEVVPHGPNLAQGVAERIAAALGGTPAKGPSGGAAIEGGPESGEARREGALTSSIAAALARRTDGTGATSGRVAPPALSVMYRETVFAVPTLSSAGAEAMRAPMTSEDATGAPAGTHGSAPAPAEIRQGRAEQLMPADRAGAPGRIAGAPVKAAADTAAGALFRAAGEVAMPGAKPQPAGGEAAQGAYPDGAALGLPGAGDQRASGTASPAGALAAQPTVAPAAPAAVPGVVKVLHIQLHPAELGVLEVRMRISDGGLEVRIEASRPETVALLKSDRDTLESVLRGAGHALDAVTVSIADKGGDASGQPSQESWQGPASGQRAEAQAGSPREQGGQFDDRSHSRPNGQANEKVHDDQDHSAAAGRPRGGLYL